MPRKPSDSDNPPITKQFFAGFRPVCEATPELIALQENLAKAKAAIGGLKLVRKAKKSTAPKGSRRVLRPWTKEDVRALKAHSKARTPVEKISKEMKRTIGALRRRAGILGIGLGAYR